MTKAEELLQKYEESFLEALMASEEEDEVSANIKAAEIAGMKQIRRVAKLCEVTSPGAVFAYIAVNPKVPKNV